MSVTVKLHPNLLTGSGANQVTLAVDGTTVGECLAQAVAELPDFNATEYLKDGELLGHVLLYLNQVDAYPDELAHATRPGDVIELIPVIGGG